MYMSGYEGLELGTEEEQQVLLTAELSLQTNFWIFETEMYLVLAGLKLNMQPRLPLSS